MTHVYGEVIAAHVDPIEKKPFFHFLPGTTSFSIATVGCNFRCPFCQNWEISQASKKDKSGSARRPLPPKTPSASPSTRAAGASPIRTPSRRFFSNTPTIRSVLAKKAGLANNFVTNGFMTAEALKSIHPYLDAANVDLKAFREETYKKVCRARLEPVLDSIRLMEKLGHLGRGHDARRARA